MVLDRDFWLLKLSNLEYDPFTDEIDGDCLTTEAININGYLCEHDTVRSYNIGGEHFHTDSSRLNADCGCSDILYHGVQSNEDNFGSYKYTSSEFTCCYRSFSTTNWWLGSNLNKNLLCNTNPWNTIAGKINWDDDGDGVSSNCSCCIQFSYVNISGNSNDSLNWDDNSTVNIVWVGSPDGRRPNGDFSFTAFELSVELSIDNATQSNISGSDSIDSIDSMTSAGVLFRTQKLIPSEESNDNQEPPQLESYYVGLNPYTNEITIGKFNNNNSLTVLATSNYSVIVNDTKKKLSIDYGKIQTIKIEANKNIYNIFLNDIVVFSNITMNDYSSGSIGLQSINTQTTFYSVYLSRTVDSLVFMVALLDIMLCIENMFFVLV